MTTGSSAETQPLLAEAAVESVCNGNKSISASNTKRSPSAGKVFITISSLLLGDFLAGIDDTFFVAIYERVATEFLSSDRADWLLLIAVLTWSTFVPIYGYIADRYDNKKVTLLAYLLFTVGCVVTSTAVKFWLAVLGRLITCAGGAGLMSMTTIVVSDYAEPSDVVVFRSYTVAAGLLGRNLGPVIGGVLTDLLGWRSAVLCEVAAAVFCALMIGWLFIPKNNDTKAASTESDEPKQSKAIDAIGLLLYAITLVVSALAITNPDKSAIPWAIAAFVFGASLFWRERSIAEDDRFIPALVFSRTLGTQLFIQILWMSIVFGTVVLIPVYFARVENATSLSTALHLLPIPVGSMVLNLVTSRVMKRTKRYKYITHLGVTFGIVGSFLLAFLWDGPVSIGRSLLPTLMGIGAGMVNASVFMAVSVMKGKKGVLIGFLCLSQELACLFGVAVSSAITNSIFARNMFTNAPSVPDRSQIITRILQDSKFAFTLPQTWQYVAAASFVKAWKIYCIVGGVLLAMLQVVVLSVVEKTVS